MSADQIKKTSPKKSNKLCPSPNSRYQEAKKFKQITAAIYLELNKLFSHLSKISNKEKQWSITKKEITYSKPIITITVDRNLVIEDTDEIDYGLKNRDDSKQLHIKISKNYPYNISNYSQSDLFYKQLSTLLSTNGYKTSSDFEEFNNGIIKLPYTEHEIFLKKIKAINLEIKNFNEKKLDDLLEKFENDNETLSEISENSLISRSIINLPVTQYNAFLKAPKDYFDNLKTKEKEKKSVILKKTESPVTTLLTYCFICTLFVWKFMNYFNQFSLNIYFHWTGIGLPLLTGFFFLVLLGSTFVELNEEWKKTNAFEKLSSIINIVGFYLGACGCVMLSFKLFNPSTFDCVQAHACVFLMSSMICLAIGHLHPIAYPIKKNKNLDFKKVLLFFIIGIGSLGLCDPNAFKALIHWSLPHINIHSPIIQILPMIGILGTILLILKKCYSYCSATKKPPNELIESEQNLNPNDNYTRENSNFYFSLH